MRSPVAIFAQADQLEKQFIEKMGIGGMMDMLDWFLFASFANSVFALENFIPLLPPLIGSKIIQILLPLSWWNLFHRLKRSAPEHKRGSP